MKATKIYNLFLVCLGVIAVIVFWYFALFTDSFKQGVLFDTIFLHVAVFVASHGLCFYAIKMYKQYIQTNENFYCSNLYIGKDNFKCKTQCSRCFKIEQQSKH